MSSSSLLRWRPFPVPEAVRDQPPVAAVVVDERRYGHDRHQSHDHGVDHPPERVVRAVEDQQHEHDVRADPLDRCLQFAAWPSRQHDAFCRRDLTQEGYGDIPEDNRQDEARVANAGVVPEAEEQGPAAERITDRVEELAEVTLLTT